MSPTKAEQNQIKSIISDSYNRLYSQFTSEELSEVGNYKVIKQIGEGSFGKVYLATHKPTRRKVVLKTSKKNDPNVVREVFYHRQFNFPYITKLYEVIVTETKVWMALEYCSGRELYEHLLTLHRIPLDECAKLFTQIVSAVYYAHSLNCVHRDLKLENILLDKNGNAKLTDFGFTRECVSRSTLETICGTTVYMAPELTERKTYDGFKIDIWSLGVILYTMINGTMPFDEDDETRTKWKIVNDIPTFDDKYTNDDSKDLIKKLLAKNPSDRPSMEEILSHPFLQPYGHIMLNRTTKIIKRQRSGMTQFHSRLERKLLKRLKQSGFDTQSIKTSIQKKKCDSLSGLWLLLLEREKACEKVDYPRASRSVLSVKKVFEPQPLNNQDSTEPSRKPPVTPDASPIIEIKKASPLGRVLSKNSEKNIGNDPQDLSLSTERRIRRTQPEWLYREMQKAPLIEPRKKLLGAPRSSASKPPLQQRARRSCENLMGASVQDHNPCMSSPKGVANNGGQLVSAKKSNIFSKVTRFFKSKKQQHNTNSNLNNFDGMNNNDGGMETGHDGHPTGDTYKSGSSSTDSTHTTDYTVHQEKKRINRPESLNSITKSSNQSTAKDPDTGSAGDTSTEPKKESNERLLKRLKSTTSSDISGETSAGNCDLETVSNQNAQSIFHDGPRSPQFLHPRPVSGISEFSNDTFNSEYSTDGNTSSLRIMDFSRSNLLHANVGDALSDHQARNSYKHTLDRRDLSIMSSTSSASERSSRTDSFYDITTASPPAIMMDIRKKKCPVVADSVLPRFDTQRTRFPKRNRGGSRRSNARRKSRGLTQSTSRTQSIIQEESSLNSQEEKRNSGGMLSPQSRSSVLEEDNDFPNQSDTQSFQKVDGLMLRPLRLNHRHENSNSSLTAQGTGDENRSCSPKFPILPLQVSAPCLVTEDDEVLRIADQEDNYSD